MKMTKQHYQLIAEVLKGHRDWLQRNSGNVMAGYGALVDRMATALAGSNPPVVKDARIISGFDRERFREACGIPSSGGLTPAQIGASGE